MNACACADCGDVLPIASLTWAFVRPLCVRCAQGELEQSKKDAEIWILEHLVLLTAVNSAWAGAKAGRA